jgi:hypothetical protein
MSEKPTIQTFPRRDDHGRAVSLAEFIVAGVGGVMVALVVLVAIDGILALFGLSSWGSASGWLALILPALLFVDDVRGWRGHPIRFVVAFVSAVVAIGVGLLVVGQLGGLPPLVSGAIGALLAAALYSPAWFLGVRWATGQHSEMGSS